MIALDAKTGMPVASFGKNGVVDLKLDDDQDIDLVTGEVGLHATPMVARDVVIVGAAHRSGGVPRSRGNVKGYVRGFDVRTGKRLWIFHTIPQPGEFGIESWEKDAWSYTGNAGVWAQISVDEELGIAYLPVELPTGDYYGGHRPGQRPVWRKPRRGRSAHRRPQVAFPIRASRHLGYGPAVRADFGGPHSERPIDQGGGAAVKAGISLRARSRDRPAGVAHRRETGGEGRRAGRVVRADPAGSDQASRLRSTGCFRKRSDRLHAGAPCRSDEARVEVQVGADVYAAGCQQARRSARNARSPFGDRRHELAGWRVRSGDAYRIYTVTDQYQSTRADGAAMRKHPI